MGFIVVRSKVQLGHNVFLHDYINIRLNTLSEV